MGTHMCMWMYVDGSCSQASTQLMSSIQGDHTYHKGILITNSGKVFHSLHLPILHTVTHADLPMGLAQCMCMSVQCHPPIHACMSPTNRVWVTHTAQGLHIKSHCLVSVAHLQGSHYWKLPTRTCQTLLGTPCGVESLHQNMLISQPQTVHRYP